MQVQLQIMHWCILTFFPSRVGNNSNSVTQWNVNIEFVGCAQGDLFILLSSHFQHIAGSSSGGILIYSESL